MYPNDHLFASLDSTKRFIISKFSLFSAEFASHSHILFGKVDKESDLGYVLKPLKQKQMVDGLCYLIQEIYGIENKNNERSKVSGSRSSGWFKVTCQGQMAGHRFKTM